MSRHWLGLQGADTIVTASFYAAQRAIDDLVRALAMGAFHGDAGLGKTFAVSHAIETHRELPAFRVEFSARSTMKRVAEMLLRELTGISHTGDRFRLTDDLLTVLAATPRLIVIDEAQRLNHECVEYLRHLWDDERTQFALALVGGNGCWDVLSRYPMLRARIYRRVSFAPLTAEDVMQIFPAFHPLYRGAAPETLLFIDDHFGHGNFRNWATFTKSAVDLTRAMALTTIEENTAIAVFELLGGRVAA